MMMLVLMDLLAGNKPLADILVVTLLPALATLISGWLSHDGWRDWINGLIVYGVVILLSAGYALLAGQIVGDWLTDGAIIAGIVAAFLAGPLKPIYDAFVSKIPSPIAAIINMIADSVRPYDPTPAPTVLRASRISTPALEETPHSTSPLTEKSQDPPASA